MQLDPATLETIVRQQRDAFDAEVDRIMSARVATRRTAAPTHSSPKTTRLLGGPIRTALRQAVVSLAALASIG